MIVGHDTAVEQFRRAWDSRSIHHAWLLAGPRGVGKASFARAAAARLLAESAGPSFDAPGLETPDDHPIARLIEAGSHPDMRWLERLEKERGEGLARDITVKQVRELGEFMGMTSALSAWRVAVIDSMDEMNKEASNALLKMLEEPPPNTIFFLVSHAPGKLLPTIRSRCRRLQFQPLGDDAMASALQTLLPDDSAEEHARLIAPSNGSLGRALAFSSLDLAGLQEEAKSILRKGDSDNSRRSKIAGELGRKAAAERYAAFLDMLPSLVAAEARDLAPAQRERAIDAYERIRELTAVAPRLSLDPAATVFQLGGILASVVQPRVS